MRRSKSRRFSFGNHIHPHFQPRLWKGGALQAAEKLVQAVILSSSEGSGFEFSSDYRFFVAAAPLQKLDA